MWLIAAALFGLAKWRTWRSANSPGFDFRALAYFFLWPGMDAPAFLARDPAIPRRGKSELLRPLLRLAFGAFLLWVVARRFVRTAPLLAGWVGMFGLILMLHFGIFDLISAGWRRTGVKAEPVMNRRSVSTSLAEFWGARWTRAFRDLARVSIFDPLAPRFGARTATLAVFVFSGLLHELVISLPAAGGYGLPTCYFMLQGGGLLAQNSRWSRRHGLRRSWRGWLFTMACVGPPSFWLFHPLFVRRVILPFLAALHAS
ncbi:MAG TPA: MBOAT family protein [Chthoniobacteraceae bacterium]|jgi:alginate O-acetyltransferase complex protein AlgI